MFLWVLDAFRLALRYCFPVLFVVSSILNERLQLDDVRCVCGVEIPDLGNDEMNERRKQTKSLFFEQMETSIFAYYFSGRLKLNGNYVAERR